MATTAVAATELTRNTSASYIAGTTGTAIVHANTHVITPAGPADKLLIVVTNTTNTEKIVTFVAGDDPPSNAEGLGTVTMTLAQGDSTPQTGFIVLEAARFLQSDGTIEVTVASGMTGFISAYQLPRGA